jgi:cobalt-zinc-cadmium efflux system outer membrane protein
MKSKLKYIAVLIACFSITRATGQTLSLDSVLTLVANNPALEAYNSKIAAQDAYANGAKNLDAPKISAGQYQTPYTLRPNGGSLMLQFEQMFTNPAKLRAKEAYLKGMSKVTAANKGYMKNQLIAQAKQYYYERVVLERKMKVLQNMQSLLDYILQDANIRLTYGKEQLPNIYKAKAERFELDNTKEQLQNEVSQKTIMLNTLMNRDQQQTFMIDTNIVLKNYEMAIVDTLSLSDSRSDIKALSRNIELQQLNAQVELSKRKFDFGITAAHMQSYGGMANQYVLMGSVTIPIVPWASKEYKANLKGIQYELEELQKNKLDILNLAQGQLATLRTDIRSKKKQFNNHNRNIIPALQNSYRTALLAYDQNTGDLPTVLQAIQSLQNARMTALDRLQEILTLQVAYEKENEKQ